MDKNLEALYALADGVQFMIDKSIQKAPFDKTQNAIVSNINNINNTISVIVNNVTIDNIPYVGSLPQINDVVKLVFPMNNANSRYAISYNNNYMILNSSTPNSNKKFKITVNDSGAISATEI